MFKNSAEISPSCFRRLRFTLIELLVVVAIIAVLASMLLPALGKARQKAKMIACANKQRQIATSMFFYSGDSDDWFPPMYLGRHDNPGEKCVVFSRYSIFTKNYFGEPQQVIDGLADATHDVYHCEINMQLSPTYAEDASKYRKGQIRYGSFVYNDFFTNIPLSAETYAVSSSAAKRLAVPAMKIKLPAICALICDGYTGSSHMGGSQQYPHGFKANVAYFDGHVGQMDYANRNRLSGSVSKKTTSVTKVSINLTGHPDSIVY